jgi:uncharacterized protein
MKARDRQAVTTLRSTLAAIDNAEAVDVTQLPPAGEGVIAGAALGVGAAEVERRALTSAEAEAIVRREAAERQAAAQVYGRAGQSSPAERLRAEAELLSTYLDPDAWADPGPAPSRSASAGILTVSRGGWPGRCRSGRRWPA